MTGGGKDLKNRCKSYGYFFKFFNLVKIGKIFSDAQSKPSDGCTEKNTASRRCLVNEKLRFAVHERRASAGGYFSEFTVSWVCEKIQNLYQKLRFAAYDRIGGVGSRAAKIDYNHNPSSMVFRNKWSFRTANRGAILIEFAICMPILIILLFYINDLVRIKRYYSQTEFVGQQMANIIQNISQSRTDKRITANDLRYALTLAYQTIYPGKTMFWQGNGLYFVNVPHPLIYYVKGNSNGTATTVWGRVFWTSDSPAISPATIRSGTQTTSHDVSQINMGTNLPPSQIYPTLKIEPGEVKIIIETLIFFRTTDPDINGKSGYTPREVFGCRLVSPKPWKNNNSNNTYTSDMSRGAFFNSVVIFTPKQGLFDETPPQ